MWTTEYTAGGGSSPIVTKSSSPNTPGREEYCLLPSIHKTNVHTSNRFEYVSCFIAVAFSLSLTTIPLHFSREYHTFNSSHPKEQPRRGREHLSSLLFIELPSFYRSFISTSRSHDRILFSILRKKLLYSKFNLLPLLLRGRVLLRPAAFSNFYFLPTATILHVTTRTQLCTAFYHSPCCSPIFSTEDCL